MNKKILKHILLHLKSNHICNDNSNGWYCGNEKYFKELHAESIENIENLIKENKPILKTMGSEKDKSEVQEMDERIKNRRKNGN